MDKFELRPHPHRNIWRVCGVVLIVMGVISLVTHYEPEHGPALLLLGAVLLVLPYLIKWKRKIDRR